MSAATGVVAVAFYVLKRRAQLERATLIGTTLTAYDEVGHAMWSRSLPESVLQLGDTDANSWRVQVLDLEGAGRNSVLVAAAFSREASRDKRGSDVLFCFAPDGTLKWRVPCQPALLDYTGEFFPDKWIFTSMVVTAARRGKRALWLSVAHSGRWPGCVLHIDSGGIPTVRFANAGNVECVCRATTLSDTIVFCGENNAYNQAFIGMIGEDDQPSTSPSVGPSDYRYRNPPAGVPRCYVLVPTSELSIANDNPYGHANFLSHEADTIVMHVTAAERSSYLQYEFSTRLEPTAVGVSGSYEMVHRRFEREGRLQHPLEHCPELSKPRVLRFWEPSSGWHNRDVAWRLPKPVPASSA
jgi:hypothetical protein